MFLNCPRCGTEVSFGVEEATSELPCPSCGNGVSATITCGLTIGDYRLRAPLGTGGMARVFLADQVSLKREVALKVLHLAHLTKGDRLEQFLEEARTAAQLNHPGIVQIYALGKENGVHYFAMELVLGASIKQILQNGPPDVDWSLMVVEKIAKALKYAWDEVSLVHRDIKPDNIMIRQDGAVKLADLGLAASVHEIRHGDVIEGSPHYIAPEPIRGDPIDFRSDVYSLGATLYHMVTGSFPFQGDSPAETAFMHLDGKLEPPAKRNSDVPVAVSKLVCRMMAKKPKNRFASYDDLIKEVKRVRSELGSGAKAKVAFKSSTPARPIAKPKIAAVQATPVNRGKRRSPARIAFLLLTLATGCFFAWQNGKPPVGKALSPVGAETPPIDRDTDVADGPAAPGAGDPAPKLRVIAAINCGGLRYQARDGTVYARDSGYKGVGRPYVKDIAIAGTKDDKLYCSNRHSEELVYEIPVPNGDYRVTLKVAEIFKEGAQRRVFDVKIEGRQVVTAWDVAKAVGFAKAQDRSFDVSVRDGALSIETQPGRAHGFFSAILVETRTTAK